MAAVKRPDYYLFGLAERLLGRARTESLTRRMAERVFESPAVRGMLRRNIRRILAHAAGREPSLPEIDSVIAAMARLHGEVVVDQYTLPGDPARYAGKAEPGHLPPLRELLAGGRGAILASPHFGDESMIYVSTAFAGIPVTVMVNDAHFYRWPSALLETLRFTGLGHGAVDGLKCLGRGEVLYLSTDLDYFPDNRTAPFFGAPFRPPQGVARMALASGSPILPAYAVFESGRYRIVGDPPIEPGPGVTQEEIEGRLLRSMEARIGRHPSHWLVLHDMWDLDGVSRDLAWQMAWIWARRRLALRWLKSG